MNLPKDIIQKVEQDFDGLERDYVLGELNRRYNEMRYFWQASVIRATLFLAKGSLQGFEIWLDTDDYRTILMHADMKSGNYEHYFYPTFEEIEAINTAMKQELKHQTQAQENLPLDLFEDGFKA